MQDAPFLQSIDALASAYPWTEQQFLQCCNQADGLDQTLVVENASLIAGFVVYNTVLDEGNIHNIAVRPRLQRSGLGKQLLAAAISDMRGLGVLRCLLEVRESNGAARGLYVGMGFEVDGGRKNYYRAGDGMEDALLMSRLL